MKDNQKSQQRPSWDETWMAVADVISRRATCPRLKTGAVIVDPRTNRLLSAGYNGAPSGAEHCLDTGCILEDNHCVRVIHGECNALLFGTSRGISLEGATMYSLYVPCVRCAMMIAQSGISEVVFAHEYHSLEGITRLDRYGVKVRRIKYEGS